MFERHLLRWRFFFESMNLFDLTGEIAVVVGGTGALGGAACEMLAEAGAAVAILGRNVQRGEERVKAIENTGNKAIFVQADATNLESLKQAKQIICEKLGTPTILVNAAGGNSTRATVSESYKVEEIQRDDWNALFDMNLTGGALLPCQVFGKEMCNAGKGSIINFASVSAHIPLSRVVAYSASKAAVKSLTQFLAREWAPYNVRVNSITPGFFPAMQNKGLLFNEDGSPSERTKSIWKHTAMNRFGKPRELGGAIIFLASEKASSFVTGTDIRIDGGFLSQTI